MKVAVSILGSFACIASPWPVSHVRTRWTLRSSATGSCSQFFGTCKQSSSNRCGFFLGLGALSFSSGQFSAGANFVRQRRQSPLLFADKPYVTTAKDHGEVNGNRTAFEVDRGSTGYDQDPLEPLEVDGAGVDEDDDDELIIDSFLRGEYDYEISDDAPCPHPDLTPANVVWNALRALRKLDDPTPSHGAAVFQRFLLPLSRRERWGDYHRGSAVEGHDQDDPWRMQVMRAALTPHLLARQIRSSRDFACLLDWSELDVTDGTYGIERDRFVGVPSLAFVNAALYFEPKGRVEPALVQFVLRRVAGGVWLIDTARLHANMDQIGTAGSSLI